MHTWSQARRHVVARRLIEDAENRTTLFTLGRYQYRCWVTNTELTPHGVCYFYDGRAALGNIPTRAFAANALYLEIIRLAYNLVTAFQRTCLPDDWQTFTLQSLRLKLFLLPGELTRPHNRPVLRLHRTPNLQPVAKSILAKIQRLTQIGRAHV